MINKIRNSSKFKTSLKLTNSIMFFFNDLAIIIFALFSNLFKYKVIYNKNIRFITGADSSHFKSLLQLCNSITTNQPESFITVYDLGLETKEIQKISETKNITEIIKFNYSDYPEFVNIKSENFGSYAWKPMIIEKELNKKNNDFILWMDAGNVIFNKLTLLKIYLSFKGFYSPHSSDNIFKRTHPDTLNLLNVSNKLYKKRNLNAAVIGVNPSNNSVVKMLRNWIEFSKNKNIIGPDGSSKKNHRFDQAVLTINFYQSNLTNLFCKSYKFFGIKIHQDID